ncbi:hypothetical protein CK203_086137 [Vitis vinifera]|uniref:DUF4283 domain-containing protein n=1 Tax=Vitis vinifera TaxID=29760 RepID=A0A438CT97_VITVI|nr:hypothetical protein CK203_086137 [Vitis vinifera]
MAAFSEGKGVSKGGKSWFAVESKTFEISIEEIRGKLRGVILERSKDFSSWIKFGEKSFSFLLEEVEDWCRGESSSRRLKVWEEGGRKYRLECLSNDADRYLLCSVRDLEAKRFCLVFPKAMSKGDLGTSNSKKEGYRVKGKEKGKGVYPKAVRKEIGELGEALWVHVGEGDLLSREEQLSRCLEWAYERWSLKGGLKISSLGGALVLFEFEDKVEADLVLLRGSRCLKMREFFLQKWEPEVGCCRNGSHPKEVWVKVIGLPFHLWSREVFKSIGESCRGFIAVDEEIAFFSELQWARILVRAPGKFKPGTLQVVVQEFLLDGESLVGKSSMVLGGSSKVSLVQEERWEVRDEGGGDTRASGSVLEVQNFQSDLQSRGIGEQVACGRRQREAAEGRRPVAADLGSSWQWAHCPLALKRRAGGVGAEAPKPTFNKDGMGFLERLSSARAPFAPAEGGTDEALMEEASRYYAGPISSFALGLWGSSSSSSFWGHAEVVGGIGGVGLWERKGSWVVLSRVWGGTELRRHLEIGVNILGTRVTLREGMEGGSEEGWSSSSLARFSRCLGMSTGGFEKEILYFLRRMKVRIEQKGKEGVTRKTSLKSLKSSGELKKLEWTVSYKKAKMGSSVGIFGGASGSGWVGRNIEWRAVNSRGATGGILVFWGNRLVELVGWEEGIFSISCRFKNCVDGVVWVFIGVYGPLYSRDREDFWENLGQLKGYGVTLVCGRDFNLVRFPEERSRGGGLTASKRRFSEVLEDLELRDYLLMGGPFTWRGGLNNQVQSRLDRFLVTDNWDNLFNGAVQGILPRPILDHFLVLLEGRGLKRGPSLSDSRICGWRRRASKTR